MGWREVWHRPTKAEQNYTPKDKIDKIDKKKLAGDCVNIVNIVKRPLEGAAENIAQQHPTEAGQPTQDHTTRLQQQPIEPRPRQYWRDMVFDLHRELSTTLPSRRGHELAVTPGWLERLWMLEEAFQAKYLQGGDCSSEIEAIRVHWFTQVKQN